MFLDENMIANEGAIALGKSIAKNNTLQDLRLSFECFHNK